MALTNQNIVISLQTLLKRFSIFTLYLIFVYWASQAIQKFLDEPTITNIKYKYGTDGGQVKPSLMTFCSADQIPEHESIIEQECGLNINVITGNNNTLRSKAGIHL